MFCNLSCNQKGLASMYESLVACDGPRRPTSELLACCAHLNRRLRAVAVDDRYILEPSGDTMVAPGDGILKNDTVPCGTAVTIRVVKQPTHGTLSSPPSRKAALKHKAARRMEGGGFTYSPNDPSAPVDDMYTYEIRCGDQVSGSCSSMLASHQAEAWR